MFEEIYLWTDTSFHMVVITSFILCGAMFLVLRSYFGFDRRSSSEICSIFHHVIVVVLAVDSLHLHRDDIPHNSVLSQSRSFGGANTIQWINIGYFLYDSVHAVMWEHGFIVHHIVALSGFLVSDYVGLGGLGNVMNTLIAEIGSIMYNVYNKNKSPSNYLCFVVIYGISRLVFAVWTCWVFRQLWIGYIDSASHYQGFIVFVFIFQSLLVCVNAHFLWIHLRKASRVLRQVCTKQKLG